MSRLQTRFKALKAESRKALIPYVMTADPYPGLTLPLMHAMVDAGADIIELGAPFSDPMADGPVIQAAAERSLEFGTSLEDVFEVVKQFRKTDDATPIILMGYLNPIEVMGYEDFASNAAQAGVDGIITVDMPPEEGADYTEALRNHSLDPVFLIAPTSTEQRIEKIGKSASGFVYYVSLKGVTGAATLDTDEVQSRVDLIRRYIDIPVGVGFGISNAESASKVSKCADAVVVGSAIVKNMAVAPEVAEAEHDSIVGKVVELLKSMRKAMDE